MPGSAPASSDRAEVDVHGSVAAGFSPLREAFQENFRLRGDQGAAFCAYVDGSEVAHIWGGESAPGVPWAEDTLVCGFSTGKGILALAIQILCDRGELDLNIPVSTFWPEFAANGKGEVTTRMFLNHTGGVPWFPNYEKVVSLDDPTSFQRYDEIVEGFAAAPCVWEPGTKSGYHSMAMGFLLGEVVRRISGKRIGEFIRDEIVLPIDGDYWVGVPESEQRRIASMTSDPALGSDEVYEEMNHRSPMGRSLFMGPSKRLDAAFRETFNHPAFRASEVAAAGPHTDARSLARTYGALSNGGRVDSIQLVSGNAIEEFRTETINDTDVIWKYHSRLGLGYALWTPKRYEWGPNDEAFGHPGLGGATAFADPIRRVGFGYVTNQMLIGLETDVRAQSLIAALYSCVGNQPS